MKTIWTVLLMGMLTFSLNAQHVMIFQPTAGLNDGTDDGSINAGKDTWTNRFNSGSNDGGNIYAAGSARSNCNTSDYKAYYQFDVLSLPDVVDSVFFGVMHTPHTNYCYSNCAADFYIYNVTSAWNEMTLTQQNEPSEDTNAICGPIPISFPNDYQIQEYDITNAYRAWKSGAINNYGFTVYSPDVGCNNAAVTFGTYTSDDLDSVNRPYLKVFYPSQAGIDEDEWILEAYPNPFSNNLKMNIDRFDECMITDVVGRAIHVNYDQSTKTFDTSSLSSGMYILHVKVGDRKSSIKLIRQ